MHMEVKATAQVQTDHAIAIKKELLERIRAKEAVVGVVGLGYVGLPFAVEKARVGFRVLGVEQNPRRAELVNRGESYIADMPTEVLKEVVDKGLLRAETGFDRVAEMDVIVIAVPTPLTRNLTPDLQYVERVTREIAQRLRPGQLISLESTTYPGTTEEVMLPMLEQSGLKVEEDFFLVHSPERVDPGNKRYTTKNTTKVVGGVGPRSLEAGVFFYSQTIEKVVPVSSAKAAELVKVFENTFRAVNIALVNELAMLCDRMGLNGIVLYGLRRFSISLEEVARAISAVGVMTLLVGGFLKFFADPEWFSASGAGEGGRLLLYDPIRGYRYNLYLPLLALSTLYWAHRWWTAGGGRYALGVVGGIGTVAFVVQSRSMLFGLLFGLILAGWRYPKWRRLVLMSLPPVVVLLGGVVVYFEPLELLSALALRSSTAERVLFELGSDPIRWLFGMGYVNPLWGYTLQDFYGVNFWTSDVGWLGIAFELGLIGVIAIALFYVLLGRALYRMPEESDASFVRALQDFFWVTVLLSPLVPAVPLHTGLYASLLALAMHAGGGLPCRRPLSGTS